MRLVRVAGLGGELGEAAPARGRTLGEAEPGAEADDPLERLGAVPDRGLEAPPELALAAQMIAAKSTPASRAILDRVIRFPLITTEDMTALSKRSTRAGIRRIGIDQSWRSMPSLKHRLYAISWNEVPFSLGK